MPDDQPSVSTVLRELPAPRLQLRWEGGEPGETFQTRDGPVTEREWRCVYELVMPLREHDIRREVWKDGEEVGRQAELVIKMSEGFTRVRTTRTPCKGDDGRHFADTPYRDGAHARWDAAQLGGLPIYVIAPDGQALPVDAPAAADLAEKGVGR